MFYFADLAILLQQTYLLTYFRSADIHARELLRSAAGACVVGPALHCALVVMYFK